MKLKPNAKVSPKLTMGPPERRSLAPVLKVRANPAEDIVQIVIVKLPSGGFKVTTFGRDRVVNNLTCKDDTNAVVRVADAIGELVPA